MSKTPDAVAPFVRSLYAMLMNPANQDAVAFLPDGRSFAVRSVRLLEDRVLKTAFKHSNFASLHRQLLLYEFVKIGGPNSHLYAHPSFQRDRPDLLENVVRVPVKGSNSTRALKPHAKQITSQSGAAAAARTQLGTSNVVAAAPAPMEHSVGTLSIREDNSLEARLEARFALLEGELAAMRALQGVQRREMDLLRQENAQLWTVVAAQERTHGFVQSALQALFAYLTTSSGGEAAQLDFSHVLPQLAAMIRSGTASKYVSTGLKRKRASSSALLTAAPAAAAVPPASAARRVAMPTAAPPEPCFLPSAPLDQHSRASTPVDLQGWFSGCASVLELHAADECSETHSLAASSQRSSVEPADDADRLWSPLSPLAAAPPFSAPLFGPSPAAALEPLPCEPMIDGDGDDEVERVRSAVRARRRVAWLGRDASDDEDEDCGGDGGGEAGQAMNSEDAATSATGVTACSLADIAQAVLRALEQDRAERAELICQYHDIRSSAWQSLSANQNAVAVL